MTKKLIFLAVFLLHTFVADAQKYELPWLLKPMLAGVDELQYGVGPDFVLIKKDRLYGLLNTKGAYILPLEYEKISVSALGIISAIKGYKQYYFDAKGTYFGDSITAVIPLSDGRYVAKKGYYWGIINKKLKNTTPFIYELIDRGNKFFLFKGEEEIDLGPQIFPDGSVSGLHPIDLDNDWPGVTLHRDPKTRKRGIMGKKGVAITPAIYLIKSGHSSGYAAASTDGKKWGIISSDGAVVVNFQFDELGEINDELSVIAKKDNLVGLLDVKTGDQLIPFGKYDKLLIVNEQTSFLTTEKNMLQGICSARGKELLPTVYDKALKSGNYLFVVQQIKSKYPLRGLFSLTGEEVIKLDSIKLHVFDNGTFAILWPNGVLEHTNELHAKLHLFPAETAQLFSKNWILQEDDQGSRFYHSTSTPSNQIWFDEVGDMEEEGVHIVKKGTYYGIVHNNGKVLVPAVIDQIKYDGPYINVLLDGKWGVLKNTFYED